MGGRATNSVHYAVNGYAYLTAGTPPGVEPYLTTRVFPGSANEQTPTMANMRLSKNQSTNTASHIYGTGKWAKVYADWFNSWGKETLPAYLAVIDEWRQVDPQAASDEALLDGMCALARADGETWYSPTMRQDSMISHVDTRAVMNMLRGAEIDIPGFSAESGPGEGV